MNKNKKLTSLLNIEQSFVANKKITVCAPANFKNYIDLSSPETTVPT
jgi:hypothetical protein